SMGGSDPLGLTERVLAALDPAEIGCVVKVVTGPGYLEAHGGALPDFPDGSVHLASPPNLPELMASADLAVVSFGMTAYELAACGTPGIYLGISDDHAESASAFQEAGLGINLGNFMSAGDVDIREAVAALASNAPRRADMGVQGQRLVDGKGAERIARVITDWTRGT
ncbi:MAG: spore coat polysaccharide biosynthesis predicted glycosyltransferase SpsG, partial [Thalassolituus oleivorans]